MRINFFPTENLNIEGERYLGKFKATKIISDDFWGGSEYTEHKYTGYWYEGAGIIEDKTTGKKYFFVLKTNNFRENYCPKDWSKKNYTLEESIINFDQKGLFYDFKPVLIDGKYKKIVDLSLGQMISQFESSKEDIPTITPERLKLEDLIKKGLCAEKSGQIKLALYD